MQTPDFEQIYEEYFSGVYGYVFALCADETLAEEVTQETFFKALRRIGSFRGDCKLQTWLCQIAKNTLYSSYRQKRRITCHVDTEHGAQVGDFTASFLDKEVCCQLHALLHNLAEPYKEVFTLRVFGELPFSDIGRLFGKTDSWARLVYYRAKRKLQEGIE